MAKVHQVSGHHLGDTWASVRYYLGLGQGGGQPIALSRFWSLAPHWAKVPDIDTVLSLFDAPGCRITLVDDWPTEPPANFYAAFESPIIPAIYRWSAEKSGASKTICYAFDGRFRSERKNPTRKEAEAVLQAIRDAGLVPVQIGRSAGLSLVESVRTLAACRLFIGPTCAWQHVAMSTGTPSVAVYRGFRPWDEERIHRAAAGTTGEVGLAKDYREAAQMIR